MDTYNAKNLTITWGGNPIAIVNNAEVKFNPEEKKMDTKTLKAMADRLQELADGAEPSDPVRGVCSEMARFSDNLIDHSVDFVCSISKSWPEFSGVQGFPVPCSLETPWDAYHTRNLWSGEYGAARRRLCGFLAQELRKEIGE